MSDNQPSIDTQNVNKLAAKGEDDLAEIQSGGARGSTLGYARLSWRVFRFGAPMIVVCFVSLLISKGLSQYMAVSGFLSNVAAESLGLGIGFMFAAWAARRKLAELAPSLVEFIAQLRKDGTIQGPGARKAVVCAVKLISEESLTEMRSDVVPIDNTCLVCELKVNTADRCPHCHLSKAIWDSEELKKIIKAV
jgi:hypothetical protein